MLVIQGHAVVVDDVHVGHMALLCGASTRPMWLGLVLAVALSIGVGVGLDLVERSPQSSQEAMESVIGAVAIFFVTTMIVWMSTHTRQMKQDLEAEAAAALSRDGAFALAVMAFLAVIKEGFETSVFLLATFSVTGAGVGVLVAVGIGWGVYAGGVRLNLARFFRVTGMFLILVAAGLTMSARRMSPAGSTPDSSPRSTLQGRQGHRPGIRRGAVLDQLQPVAQPQV